MTRIWRPRKAPRTLSSVAVTTTLRRLHKLKRRKSTDFVPHWNADDVRVALWKMQYHKCSYCERIRELKYEPDVEHFRPKVAITGCKGQSGYWWLAYEWTNLFFSCRVCNQKYKKNHFPLKDGSSRARKPTDPLQSEECLLINPSREDPEDYLSWDWTRGKRPIRHVFVYGLEEKGRTTVEVLGLNHGELARERGQVVDLLIRMIFDYQRMVDSGVDDENPALKRRKRLLLEELAPERPFLALRRYILRACNMEEIVSEAERSNHRSSKSRV